MISSIWRFIDWIKYNLGWTHDSAVVYDEPFHWEDDDFPY